MPLDVELLQEASKQRLCEDEFDDPMIQLKVRGVLGSDFCDAIGIYYAADEQDDDITVGLDEIPSGDNKWTISHVATQKRAFKDCTLKMIGAHKSQNNQMNHHALKYLTPGDHPIGQIITALKKIPGWKGKAIDAS